MPLIATKAPPEISFERRTAEFTMLDGDKTVLCLIGWSVMDSMDERRDIASRMRPAQFERLRPAIEELMSRAYDSDAAARRLDASRSSTDSYWPATQVSAPLGTGQPARASVTEDHWYAQSSPRPARAMGVDELTHARIEAIDIEVLLKCPHSPRLPSAFQARPHAVNDHTPQ
jgi:hypothetical protein